MSKPKSILDRAKAQVREIRTEATIQAYQTATNHPHLSFGAIAQMWKNFIDAIDVAVKESKRSKRKK